MATLKIRTPKVFLPLLQPAPYKGAWGGRGSAKSHTMAENLVERCLMVRGTDWVCLREYQASIEQSSKKLIEEKIETLGVGSYFRVYNKVIQTPGDGHIIFEGLQDHTADSIKSLQGFHGSWVEEAQSISATSLQILRPTLRAEGAERWFSWNPRRATDAVDKLLRGPLIPTGAIVVKANWSDNPFFPAELERERLDCLRNEAEQYEHIWEGGYATVLDGAYYARYILEAKESGRIGRVPPAPLITYRAFCDLGGTGARSDAFTIWIAQFVGKEVRVLNYYE